VAKRTIPEIEGDVISCQKCPRLVTWREQVAVEKRRAFRNEVYWGRPVPGFGDPCAEILVVGLAPGAHGSNRTGRMFTGDASGDFLYPALFRAGFASQPTAIQVGDSLTLNRLFISAVCRCAPPDNKPSPVEIQTCLPYLQAEMTALSNLKGLVALGKIAFDACLKILNLSGSSPFSHGVLIESRSGRPWLLASYHPSRQNTQTGRLTQTMFDAIWQTCRSLLRTGSTSLLDPHPQ